MPAAFLFLYRLWVERRRLRINRLPLETFDTATIFARFRERYFALAFEMMSFKVRVAREMLALAYLHRGHVTSRASTAGHAADIAMSFGHRPCSLITFFIGDIRAARFFERHDKLRSRSLACSRKTFALLFLIRLPLFRIRTATTIFTMSRMSIAPRQVSRAAAAFLD